MAFNDKKEAQLPEEGVESNLSEETRVINEVNIGLGN
jgi:hypothetical protein